MYVVNLVVFLYSAYPAGLLDMQSIKKENCKYWGLLIYCYGMQVLLTFDILMGVWQSGCVCYLSCKLKTSCALHLSQVHHSASVHSSISDWKDKYFSSTFSANTAFTDVKHCPWFHGFPSSDVVWVNSLMSFFASPSAICNWRGFCVWRFLVCYYKEMTEFALEIFWSYYWTW